MQQTEITPSKFVLKKCKDKSISFVDETLSMCRICLASTDNKCISIFDEYKGSTILGHIVMLATINVSNDDGLPSKICDSCLLELDSALNFKIKCESSDVYLHRHKREINDNELNKTAIKKEDLKEDEQISTFKAELDEADDSFDHSELAAGSDITDRELEIKNKFPVLQYSSVQCHDCGENFKSKCKLRVHWKSTHKPKAYVCQRCKRSFKSLVPLNRHMKSKDKSCLKAKYMRIEGEGKNRLFHCLTCDYSSQNIKYLINHLVSHTRKKSYTCNLCPSSYKHMSALYAHKETAHQEYKVEITCDFCGKFIQGRDKVYRHLLSHSDGKYQCDHCKKFVKTKQYLVNHLKLHSGVKSYTCDVCAKSFYTLSLLSNHKRYTHNSELNSCNICGYKTKSEKLMRKHKIKHGAFDYCCSVCGMFFSNVVRLKTHKLHHEAKGSKKFACPLCLREYMSVDRVIRHAKDKHRELYYEGDQEFSTYTSMENKVEKSNETHIS